ncbi:hypothetical protein GQ43DRAFT_474169 [Delitschia confertaspora ATCC 74209]|uniref:Zn(2)-C6 fungal-type domain-containing protein n=1 Tax=Delitschia confertaspora ATCC 74209 TaxID=1513339 RepID=A0A9P4MWD5_9PLEO|nr:hypothetical protein GQ43DRAFT_474169 [Delitschia confertaspora ATCC 74209]
MTEPASVFNQPAASEFPTENVLKLAEPPPGTSEGSRKKQQSQQPRQLLSCTKCRERKVKCDRTKPCSACCARGAPKECHFLVAEGGDYTPIQQSYELRKLRAENLRLKERLRAAKLSIEDEDSGRAPSPDSLLSDGSASKSSRRTTKQKRFKGQEWSDSIYFGSPGLANVLHEFAQLNLAPQTIAHAMPRGADIYASRDLPMFPFATMWRADFEDCIPALLDCLPQREELLSYLDAFQKRVQACSFPHTPNEITKSEVERFLSDAKKNALRFPDMLALLFAALALGCQNSVFDKCGGKWVEGAMEKEKINGDVYIAASMQALRMASFMNRPTLLAIQALIMMGPYLTNSGRFLDAWTLFGTTIRLAHSIGLHRNPRFLEPAPPLREAMLRRALWWWMLHMDQQYSMTLGRPLGISGIGDCPPPDDLTTNPTVLRFAVYVNQFTLLARQILSSDRLNNAKIDEFTDALRSLWETVPELLQFDDTWLDDEKETPEWPIDCMAAVFYSQTHNYLILLNRQRIDNTASGSFECSKTPPTHRTPTPSAIHTPPSSANSAHQPFASPTELHRGRSLVISSSISLLSVFLYFYARIPAALICWTIGQQAFNSCMILLLDAMETGEMSRIEKVEKAYAVFVELERKGVHKLAGLAVERISWGLSVLKGQITAAHSQGSRIHTQKTATGGNDDVEMQGAADGISEGDPVPGSEVPMDTVMGNTGMLLLEDPGLQCFVPESFSPLTWKMAGDSLQGISRLERKQQAQELHQSQRQEQQKQGVCQYERNQGPGKDTSVSSVSVTSGQTATPATTKQKFRSADAVTGASRSSPGSAPHSYATFYTTTPPSRATCADGLEQQQQQRQRPQGPGLVSPMSPPASGGAFTGVVQQDSITQPQLHARLAEGNEGIVGADLHQQPPAHLRHHSYPQMAREPPPQHLGTQPHQHQYQCQPHPRSHPSLPTPLTSAYPSPMLPQDGLTTASPPTFVDHHAPLQVFHSQDMRSSVNPSWAARPAMMSSTASAPIFAGEQGYDYGGTFVGEPGEGNMISQVEQWQRYLDSMNFAG